MKENIIELVKSAAKKNILYLPHADFLAIITAYVPDEEMWKNNFSERQSK